VRRGFTRGSVRTLLPRTGRADFWSRSSTGQGGHERHLYYCTPCNLSIDEVGKKLCQTVDNASSTH
jgi:hypothetical protein